MLGIQNKQSTKMSFLKLAIVLSNQQLLQKQSAEQEDSQRTMFFQIVFAIP